MPTFETPDPITATIELAVGDPRIAAADRTDTVVEVRPSNPDTEADVRAAAETRVEFTPGPASCVVRAPKQRGLGLFGKPGLDRHEFDLPAGSQVHAEAGGRRLPAARPDRRLPAQDVGRRHPDRGDGLARCLDQRGRGDVDPVGGRRRRRTARVGCGSVRSTARP